MIGYLILSTKLSRLFLLRELKLLLVDFYFGVSWAYFVGFGATNSETTLH